VIDFNPDIAVIHTTTPSIYNDIKHAELVKENENDCMTVLVGTHVSALPEDTIRLSEKVDVIVKGEFDYTLRDLAKVADGEGDLKDVLGIAYRDDGNIIFTPERPLIENLDGDSISCLASHRSSLVF
jgi:radical SAM superfamily enzyme YgiQ (UPF0313 family)